MSGYVGSDRVLTAIKDNPGITTRVLRKELNCHVADVQRALVHLLASGAVVGAPDEHPTARHYHWHATEVEPT